MFPKDRKVPQPRGKGKKQEEGEFLHPLNRLACSVPKFSPSRPPHFFSSHIGFISLFYLLFSLEYFIKYISVYIYCIDDETTFGKSLHPLEQDRAKNP